jgi:putative spermidine/putrescine transport system permease protein
MTPARINRIIAWSLLVFLVAPALIAIPVSLTSENYLSLPWEGISFQYYHEVFTSPDWLSSFFQSTVIGVTSAALATVIGTLAAVGLWRLSSRWGEIVRGLLLLPLVIPPIIAAMAFYRLFVPLGLIDSYTGLILAHAVLAAPLVLITVGASLGQFRPAAGASLAQSGGQCGANAVAGDPSLDPTRGDYGRDLCLHRQLG